MKIKKNPDIKGLIWIEKLTGILDSHFRIPGTKFRFGIDPILGLFPIVGDITSFAISSGMILFMARYGASRKLIILMTGNILLDTIIGSIPVLGNIFDFTFKANNRNLRLLQRYYKEGKYKGKGTGILVAVFVSLSLLMLLLFFLLIKLGAWMIELINLIFSS